MLAALLLTVAAGVVFRFVTRSDLWLDEALTVNVAKLPLSDLREALRHDGAPPLFYVLLHGWISVFGSSDVAVRALPGVLSVATLPAAWLAGRRLAGRWGAWAAVAVLVSSPYAIRYATETRMYALAMFLVLWGYLALRRALERGSFPIYVALALITAALCYTLYWSFYLLAVVGIGLVWRAWRAPELADRQAARGVIVSMIAGGVMFLPWLSTFTYQLQHTGTPWGDARVPWFGVAEAFVQFAGGDKHGEAFIYLPVLIVLPLLALFGAAVNSTHIDLDLRTRPAVRWETAAAFATLVLGLVASFIASTAFEGRYAAVMFPLLALVIGYGVTTFGNIRVRAGVLAFIVVLGFVGGMRNVLDNRTQAAQVADVINAEAKPGDTVVYCPDQIGPAVHRLLSPSLHVTEVTYPRGTPPLLIDWVDYVDKIRATDPTAFGRRELQRVSDHTIWYVAAFGYHNVEGKCEALRAELSAVRHEKQHVVANDNKFFEYQGLFEYPPS